MGVSTGKIGIWLVVYCIGDTGDTLNVQDIILILYQCSFKFEKCMRFHFELGPSSSRVNIVLLKYEHFPSISRKFILSD